MLSRVCAQPEGATQFTYPVGNTAAVITVTRDGKRVNVDAVRVTNCELKTTDFGRPRTGKIPLVFDPLKVKTDEAGRFGSPSFADPRAHARARRTAAPRAYAV